MKRDLDRHKLLSFLAAKRVKFEANNLDDNEHLGISFNEIKQKLNCDILELNLIASELYENKEISYTNLNMQGLICKTEGLTSFANNKYKARYWRDFWTNLFTISQIVVPILALVIALVAVMDSRHDKALTKEILLFRREMDKMQEIQQLQNNLITTTQNRISSDSLINNKLDNSKQKN